MLYRSLKVGQFFYNMNTDEVYFVLEKSKTRIILLNQKEFQPIRIMEFEYTNEDELYHAWVNIDSKSGVGYYPRLAGKRG